MSYADGLLSPEEARALEHAIAGDAEALRLVEQFRRTRDLVSEAYAEPFNEVPPSRLVEAIMKAPSGNASGTDAASLGHADGAAAGARILTFPDLRRARPAHLALAASMIFALGFGLANLLALPDHGGRGAGATALAVGPVPAASPLGDLLEHRAGGELSGSGEAAPQFMVVASFKDGAGRFCRELELVADSQSMAPLSAAIACREPDGWVVEGAARIATLDDTGGYRPASAGTKDAIIGMERLLGLGEPLTAEEEAAALAKRWR
ncbi:MAG: hypothetical protein GC150_15995 [Rhizobiales bacterium]|nr:hypothetical protein [Hyphomicrobiales bacterium]